MVEYTRREATKLMAGLVGALQLGMVPQEERRQEYRDPNVRIIRKSSESTSTLEAMIMGGRNDLDEKTVLGTVPVEKVTKKPMPKIVYVVDYKIETADDGKTYANLDMKGVGSAHILTSDGYVLTNNHVVSDALTDPTSLAILYDSATGEAQVMDICAVNATADLALAKVKPPKGGYKDVTPLTRRTPMADDAVMAPTFKRYSDISGHLKTVLESADLKQAYIDGRVQLTFRQTRPVPRRFRGKLSMGNIIPQDKYQFVHQSATGRRLAIPKDHHVFLTSGTSLDRGELTNTGGNIIPGNSGSSMYNQNGELTGVVASLTVLAIAEKSDCHAKRFSMFVGPDTIRNLLRTYVATQK